MISIGGEERRGQGVIGKILGWELGDLGSLFPSNSFTSPFGPSLSPFIKGLGQLPRCQQHRRCDWVLGDRLKVSVGKVLGYILPLAFLFPAILPVPSFTLCTFGT